MNHAHPSLPNSMHEHIHIHIHILITLHYITYVNTYISCKSDTCVWYVIYINRHLDTRSHVDKRPCQFSPVLRFVCRYICVERLFLQRVDDELCLSKSWQAPLWSFYWWANGSATPMLFHSIDRVFKFKEREHQPTKPHPTPYHRPCVQVQGTLTFPPTPQNASNTKELAKYQHASRYKCATAI